VASFKYICFVAPEYMAWVVAKLKQQFKISLWRCPIVTGKYHNSVFGYAVVIQRLQYLPGCSVYLEHEIAIWIGVALAFELHCGQNRGMWSRQRKVEKKRSAGIRIHMGINKGYGLFGKYR